MLPTHIVVLFGDSPTTHKFEEGEVEKNNPLYDLRETEGLGGQHFAYNGWRVMVVGEIIEQEAGVRVIICQHLREEMSVGTTMWLHPLDGGVGGLEGTEGHDACRYHFSIKEFKRRASQRTSIYQVFFVVLY